MRKVLYLRYIWLQNIIISVPSFPTIHFNAAPTTHFLHFIHKQDNALKEIQSSFSSWTCIPEAALPWKGNCLPTHSKISTMQLHPFPPQALHVTKWRLPGLHSVLVYTMWGKTCNLVVSHVENVSTDTRKCEDTQWRWLVRNNRFHSRSSALLLCLLGQHCKLWTSWKVSLFVSVKHTWSGLFFPPPCVSLKHTLSEAKISTPKPVWKARCPSCLMI